MKTAWWILMTIALLCAALCTWLLITSGAGARTLAASQLFIAGAAASFACAGASAMQPDRRKRLIGVGLIAGYGVALVALLAAMGNVR